MDEPLLILLCQGRVSDVRSIQFDVNLMKFDSRKGWDFSHGELKKRSDEIFFPNYYFNEVLPLPQTRQFVSRRSLGKSF